MSDSQHPEPEPSRTERARTLTRRADDLDARAGASSAPRLLHRRARLLRRIAMTLHAAEANER